MGEGTSFLSIVLSLCRGNQLRQIFRRYSGGSTISQPLLFLAYLNYYSCLISPGVVLKGTQSWQNKWFQIIRFQKLSSLIITLYDFPIKLIMIKFFEYNLCSSCCRFVFCFVMRETLCCLCQTIIKLILLKLFTPPPDI